ncbi:MAG: helix-turn-helix domain-containing protein [Stackebrandtia sp.]
MTSRDNPAVWLAKRLRGLREHAWPDVSLTQRDLARALGGNRPLSVPLISSWENLQRPVVPPAERLLAYAAFFASRRSAEASPYRLLDDAELTEAEREQRDRLERELLSARSAATNHLDTAPADRSAAFLDGPWRFTDGKPVTIVCADVPVEQRAGLAEPDDLRRKHAELYAYADLDSLVELYGHIRAANPLAEVKYCKASDLEPDDYTTHLVLLGGVHWNQATSTMIKMLNLPVWQGEVDPADARRSGGYHVTDDSGQPTELRPIWDDGGRHLLGDVGHFVRAANPLNGKRTLTICNGIDSRGVLGTVRALIDERFRDRNSSYLKTRFAGYGKYSVLTRVQIIDGAVVTPDWTVDATRLHEWKDR